jgi:hypothetical protein
MSVPALPAVAHAGGGVTTLILYGLVGVLVFGFAVLGLLACGVIAELKALRQQHEAIRASADRLQADVAAAHASVLALLGFLQDAHAHWYGPAAVAICRGHVAADGIMTAVQEIHETLRERADHHLEDPMTAAAIDRPKPRKPN